MISAEARQTIRTRARHLQRKMYANTDGRKADREKKTWRDRFVSRNTFDAGRNQWLPNPESPRTPPPDLGQNLARRILHGLANAVSPTVHNDDTTIIWRERNIAPSPPHWREKYYEILPRLL